jgi:hypothetical protein
MRPFERREAGVEASYKLAAWDGRACSFREAKGTYPTAEAAKGAARTPGRYRISRVESGRFSDVATFEVSSPAASRSR